MDKAKILKVVLFLFGLVFIFGVYPLTIVWPSGWAWGGGMHSHYLPMILGVYATLGVFLILASRDPGQHRSLIAFTAWSSLVHGAIMGYQAMTDGAERGHLYGDVPVLIVVFIVLLVLAPPRAATR